MPSIYEVEETNKMVEQENLDIRTITIGISLFDCMDADLDKCNEKIYKKITGVARDLVMCGVTKDDMIQIAYGYGLFTGGLGLHYGAELLRPCKGDGYKRP